MNERHEQLQPAAIHWYRVR